MLNGHVGHKKRHLSTLSLGEKIDIVHSALVGKDHHLDIARRFQVSPGLVSRLSLKARRQPGFLDGLQGKKDKKEQQIGEVGSIVNDMLRGHELILSSNHVLRKLR